MNSAASSKSQLLALRSGRINASALLRPRRLQRIAAAVLFCCAAAPGRAAVDADAVRQFFEALDAGAPARVADQVLREPAALALLYRARAHRPLWAGGGELVGSREALVAAIDRASMHGLEPRTYHRDALAQAAAVPTLALELLASDALLHQIRHRSAGAVSPTTLDPDWFIAPAEVDATGFVGALVQDPSGFAGRLEALWPQTDEYRALLAARARILALDETETVNVPPGPLLKPGQSGPRVAALKQRLFGPGDYSDVYDPALRAAVEAFQRSVGLETDAIVGAATLEFLNARSFSWIDRIDANLERWRWLPQDVPDDYVRVNIASYRLRVIADNAEVLAMNVIAGRPFRRTPVFTEMMRYIVLNPYWNVPYKLAVEDKLPLLRADAPALAALGYEARRGGASDFVAVDAIDWSAVRRAGFDYQLRQRPGPANALGTMKFMLPNPHAVYLHDTPARDLFARQERGFSSGCIRLERPADLARWVIGHDGQTDTAAAVDGIVGSGVTTTVNLRRPLPVYILYFTAFTDAQGDVTYRRDIYERDAPLVAALRADR